MTFVFRGNLELKLPDLRFVIECLWEICELTEKGNVMKDLMISGAENQQWAGNGRNQSDAIACFSENLSMNIDYRISTSTASSQMSM